MHPFPAPGIASDLYAPGHAWEQSMNSDQAKSAVMASGVMNITEKFDKFAGASSDTYEAGFSDPKAQQEWLQKCFQFHQEILADIDRLLCFANGDLHPDLLKVVTKMRAFAIEHSGTVIDIDWTIDEWLS